MRKKRYDPGHPFFPPPYGPSPHTSEGVREREPAPGLLPKELSFIEEDHRRIHHFVVRELPQTGMPLPWKLDTNETLKERIACQS